MAIRIISDTSCDLTQELIEKYQLVILPLCVLDDEREYVDTVDITADEIYENMRQGKMYKTAQLSPMAIQEAFISVAEAGDDAIFLPLSSGISGTYNTACIIAQDVMEKYPNSRIEVWDSKGTTGGLGILILETAKDVAAGKSMKEILDRLKFNTYHTQYLFTVDDIEYLHRGGRVNGIEKVLGSLLQIKPVLHVDREGRLAPVAKVRGRQKSFAKLVELMGERMADVNFLKEQTVFITHGAVLEEANQLKEMIYKAYGVENFYIHTLSATVGAHTGPGLMSVYFLDQKYSGMGDGEHLSTEEIRK